MKFSKIGKHTIRCVISEQEIQDLGYTIEEIMSNGERTQEFMNQIFDMAEQSFETKFELGIKTVRADFMSDHTLALTFSEHPGSDEMMEHLKDIVNGLMNAIPQQKWAQINEARQNEGNPDQVPVYATIVFADFDRLLRYAKNIIRAASQCADTLFTDPQISVCHQNDHRADVPQKGCLGWLDDAVSGGMHGAGGHGH